jgi:hypothetical protein
MCAVGSGRNVKNWDGKCRRKYISKDYLPHPLSWMINFCLTGTFEVTK